MAAIYKQRWQVELFFKALKQNLRVKTFVGTSANALKIQIWTALISILLLKFLQLRSRLGWSLSRLVALLQRCSSSCLFTAICGAGSTTRSRDRRSRWPTGWSNWQFPGEGVLDSRRKLEGGTWVEGSVQNGQQAVCFQRRARGDLAILDCSGGPQSALQIAAEIRQSGE